MGTSFKHDEWYIEQTGLWHSLAEDGWQFSRPAFVPGVVGIEIRKGSMMATFRVPENNTPEAIHAWLLRFCTRFASAAMPAKSIHDCDDEPSKET